MDGAQLVHQAALRRRSGRVCQGVHRVDAAQFPTVAEAQAVYDELKQVEVATSLRIDGVVIAERDLDGKVHLGTMTDHSTKTGLKWGVVGGVALGILFPPSILVGAVSVGVVGSILGKVRNLGRRSDLTDQLADVMTPGTAGIIALVEDTAVVEVQKALAKADRIVTEAVDKQTAAEIDRQAAAAKAELSV